MATTLSSKTFFIPKTATIPLGFIDDWFKSVDRGLYDCRLVVTLEAYNGQRQRKSSAAEELASLVAGNQAAWKKGSYTLWFASKTYLWRGASIHITAGEALFLYRFLVLEETCPMKAQRLYNMRKRLGKDFLADIEETGGEHD